MGCSRVSHSSVQVAFIALTLSALQTLEITYSSLLLLLSMCVDCVSVCVSVHVYVCVRTRTCTVYMYQGKHVAVRGQLSGVSSLLALGVLGFRLR